MSTPSPIKWFIVQTTDLQRRQLSSSLVDSVPGSWWAKQFGSAAVVALPPVIDRQGELPVFPVNVASPVLDALIQLMHRPTRIIDAHRVVPPSLKDTRTLRDWLDALDEACFGPLVEGPLADDDPQPPTKRPRYFDFRDELLMDLGRLLGDFLIANHPRAKEFIEGSISGIEMAMLICYGDAPGLSFTIPHNPLSSVHPILRNSKFAEEFDDTDDAGRAMIFAGLSERFPGAFITSRKEMCQSETSKTRPRHITTWPLDQSVDAKFHELWLIYMVK
jgi:hypothetical protein